MPIQSIRQLVKTELEAVNQFILELIQIEEVPLITNMTEHLLSGGGKQLRPLIALLTCKALDYKGSHHITLAAMLEFFHTATLLHDDVIDESTLRRGKKTAHEIWGNKASVLVGDYLFTLHTKLLLQMQDLKILGLMTHIANQIGLGEIKQLINRHHSELSIPVYFDIIQAKTSLLFAAAGSISGILNHQFSDELYQYGLRLGNAFQLIDDALDYSSDSTIMGKNNGDDLADGKTTLPLIHALQHCNEHEKKLIKESLKNGLRENFPVIVDILKNYNSIEYTKEIASKEAGLARTALAKLPPSIYKDALIDLTHYCIQRSQ